MKVKNCDSREASDLFVKLIEELLILLITTGFVKYRGLASPEDQVAQLRSLSSSCILEFFNPTTSLG